MRAVLCWKKRAVGTCGLEERLVVYEDELYSSIVFAIKLTSVEQARFLCHGSYDLARWVDSFFWVGLAVVSKQSRTLNLFYRTKPKSISYTVLHLAGQSLV